MLPLKAHFSEMKMSTIEVASRKCNTRHKDGLFTRSILLDIFAKWLNINVVARLGYRPDRRAAKTESKKWPATIVFCTSVKFVENIGDT